MTQEEMKKFLASLNKNIKGSISEKEMSIFQKITPKDKDIDLKFIAEKTGAAVSEEELKMMKKMLNKR